MTRRFGFLGVAATLLALGIAGCQKDVAPDETAVKLGLCNQEAAAGLVGKDKLTVDQAKQITGAAIIRQVKPGDPVTMDYRQERLTLETDQVTGKVIRASCG